MGAALFLNNKQFFYDQIARGEFDQNSLSDFEKSTLNFCCEWLNGVSEFELKTSGSTGTPKTIVLSRRQMQESARLTINKLDLIPEDTALICLDTAYIGGKMMLVRGFEGDLKMLIVTPSTDPLNYLDEGNLIDFAAFVPIQIQQMLQGSGESREALNRMKAIIVGGGAINFQLEAAIASLKAPVYSTYGMTETISHIALKRMNGPDRADFYTILDGVKIDQDKRGCLTISSVVTNDETLITNDLVELIDARSFRWLGRIDNVVNSGGIKINVERLENDAAQMFLTVGIRRRFIFGGISDELLGEKLILIIEGKPLSKEDEIDLLSRLEKDLPPYHAPKQLSYLPTFKETKTGKIQRKQSIASFQT